MVGGVRRLCFKRRPARFGFIFTTSRFLPLFPCFLSLELLADVQYAFGLPFYPAYQGQFSTEEQSLALKVMQYFANFIRSGYVVHCSLNPITCSLPTLQLDAKAACFIS